MVLSPLKYRPLNSFWNSEMDKRRYRDSDSIRLEILQAVARQPLTITGIRRLGYLTNWVWMKKHVNTLVKAGYLNIISGEESIKYSITPAGLELLHHLKALAKARRKISFFDRGGKI